MIPGRQDRGVHEPVLWRGGKLAGIFPQGIPDLHGVGVCRGGIPAFPGGTVDPLVFNLGSAVGHPCRGTGVRL